MALRGAPTTAPAAPVVGRLSDAAVERALPAWRTRLRAPLVTNLERELPYLYSTQQRCRTPLLDVYFVNSSLLGTHTFFVIFLPLFFWFGYADTGRGLLYTLAGGGYWTSILKDLFCVARPAAPPLVRLSTGNHGQMYGFPSAHSSTAMSMSTFFFAQLAQHRTSSLVLDGFACAALLLFTTTITFGRLYTGMHSMVDVGVGMLVGFSSGITYQLFKDNIDVLTRSNPALLTALVTPTTLFLALVHPLPAEACPCFDEAIAFISVAQGMLLGKSWSLAGYSFFLNASESASAHIAYQMTPWKAGGRILLGTFLIFAWRTLGAKAVGAVLNPFVRKVALAGKTRAPPSQEKSRREDAFITTRAVTKVFVYTGLGYIASIGLPDLFLKLGI